MMQSEQSGKKAREIMLWLRWGDTDYRAARLLLLGGVLVQGAALSDSAIEKYLKSMYVDQDLNVPPHHEVARLYSHIRWKTGSDLKVNQSYLRLLEKAYRLRYPDNVGEGFNIALNQIRLLAELDRTVGKITERIRVREHSTGRDIALVLEQAVLDEDSEILVNNVRVNPEFANTLFSSPSRSYDLRKYKSELFETSYMTVSVEDGPDHEREGFPIKNDFQFQAAYLPILDSPNTATRNGWPLVRVPQQTSGSSEVDMEDRPKQIEAFAQMLELMRLPPAERPEIMRGVDLFFDRGWPSNHVTVGMAARAGAGLVPPVYQGLSSEAEYKALTDAEEVENRRAVELVKQLHDGDGVAAYSSEELFVVSYSDGKVGRFSRFTMKDIERAIEMNLLRKTTEVLKINRQECPVYMKTTNVAREG